jgi:hypothetical protein
LTLFILGGPCAIVLDALILSKAHAVSLTSGQNMLAWLAPPGFSMALLTALIFINRLLHSEWAQPGALDSTARPAQTVATSEV